MQRSRSFYDGDRLESRAGPTNFKTAHNQNEVYCGMCGESFYVSDILFEKLNRVIEETLENPFICEDCRDEYEELAHPH